MVGSKDAAKEVAKQIEPWLALGEGIFSSEDDKQPEPTFGVYAESWIKTTVPATCKTSTVRDYQDILNNHILPVFKNMALKGITRWNVKDFLLTKINAGYAKSTVSHMKDVVSGVLNKALDDEVISANPAYRLGRLGKFKSRSVTINPLSREELKLLLDTARNKYENHYALFLLLARTGMGIGEALGLRWGDVDFNGRFIEVQRSIVR